MDAPREPSVKRQGRGAARERAIVAAAAELIAEKGLSHVRVSDVAERAKMATGHVTYYFPSRTTLLVQAVRQFEDAYAAELAERTSAVLDPWERIATFVRLSAADGPRDRGWVLWFEVWALAAREPEVAQMRDELSARSTAVLRRIIEDGISRREFKKVDPSETAALIAATIDGLSVQLALGSTGTAGRTIEERCLDLARALLARRR